MSGSVVAFFARLVVGAAVLFLIFGAAPLVAWLVGSTWPSIWALLVPGVVVVGGMCFMIGSAIAGDAL